MSSCVLLDTVAKKPAKPDPDPPSEDRGRIDLRVDPELRARIKRQADRFNLGISAYLRQAAIERLERDEATDPDASD
jgi:hypothetical protein